MRARSALALVLLLAVCPAALAADLKPFGFKGIEFYKLDWGTNNLRVADINGDGLNDIVVVNNRRARIECLLQRKNPGAAPAPAPLEPNELPDDLRFEKRPYLAEKRIFSLELGDLNGDGRTDMVYYGDPPELVVVYQNAKGEWDTRRKFDIKDGSRQGQAICIADVNGDGRNDLVLMATDGTYFLLQNEKGVLEAPVKEAGLPEGTVAILAGDFNGDRRTDLLYVSTDETTPLSFRLQGDDKRLGPEQRCETDALRELCLDDMHGDGVIEVAGIQARTGRLVLLRLSSETPVGSIIGGALDRYKMRNGQVRRPRAMAIGNFSGGALPDILVGDPESAEVELFVQVRPGVWNRKASFPALQAVTALEPFAIPGEKRTQAVFLSPDESTLGLSVMEESGRLSFPRALPLVGKPSAMVVGDLMEDGAPEILYVSSAEGARGLHVLALNEKKEFAEKLSMDLRDVRTDPDGLLIADINQDGMKDILLFTPFQEMRILKQGPAGKFTDVSGGADYGKSLVNGARLSSVCLADMDGDGKLELLLAGKNFARALKLDDKDRLQVVDQFNGRAPNSQIAAVAAADLDNDKNIEILLADSANSCISVLKRNALKTYEIVENYKTGPLSLTRFLVADLTGEGKPQVLMLSQNEFSILRPGAPSASVRETASYETPIRDGFLSGLAIGDLNGDKVPDILLSEGTKNILEIVAQTDGGKQLRRVLNWPVFESKAYRGGQDRNGEPREFLIEDVTGDGKADVVMLIHDRVLIYPQE